ncbi:unnamed protein product [Arabidopsis thaliana]|uniref:25S rRNA (uridine-N(3))-methyltransferase BMT5-like domain-containing protein n=1 Tax=Arabidopsis thaliana TaxID=3702 RepID=A0A5S9YEL6_ARATH|nr:unnamed protein product [Arabidopsis thaliana]VYS70504.1 unnamed protein product [Arabidopsis thaliana]
MMNVVEELGIKYTDGKANVEGLELFGCTVVHGVNVHSMSSDYRLGRYDRIIFNFPHSGLGFGSEHDIFFIMLHQGLVRGFLESARKMLKDEDGEIHVTHKTTDPFNRWGIETLAGEKGLRLIGEIEFHKWAFPGYSNKKGGGSNCNSTFPIVKASTFMFKI